MLLQNLARVLPKLRIAEAFDITDSGITSQEYSYALKAYFDFVVTTEEYVPQFAVEFDGRQLTLAEAVAPSEPASAVHTLLTLAYLHKIDV